jgi:hypothetical protein
MRVRPVNSTLLDIRTVSPLATFSETLYRLALGAGDALDADEFRRLAATALEERGDGRRQLLERARAL